MKEPLEDSTDQHGELKNLRHDIRNQLSGIQLAVEQLRYEITDSSVDGAFYLDTIASSCTIINTLLKDKE